MEINCNPLSVILFIKEQLEILDDEQLPIVKTIPDGMLRIRGIAGTGKTILFAKLIAKIHQVHPDWKIAFIFFTQSLYNQIESLIRKEVIKKTDEEPDWNQIEVLHAWGQKEKEGDYLFSKRDGFYRNLAIKCGKKPLSSSEAERELQHLKRYISPPEKFEYICDRLEKEVTEIPTLYDVILIDEGQDLPFSFYRLAWKTLSEPKRLYWAYDEAQNISSLTVPKNTDIFGNNIGKFNARILNACYRTPRLLLMVAHAINMGLLRQEGPLQGVTTEKDWNDLGYEILEGDFSDFSVKAKNLVKIARCDRSSPHPIDKHPDLAEASGDLLVLETCSDETQEIEWIADAVAQDIADGLDPNYIIITAIRSSGEGNYFLAIKNALIRRGVDSLIAGIDESADTFWKPGYVTIASIYRVKGNEAYKVYVARFHCITSPEMKPEDELRKRNEAFVALSRSRIWCTITGMENPIFDELRKAKEQYPHLIFPAFNQKSLKKVNSARIDES